MHNLLAHSGRSGRCLVPAFVATAFAEDDAEAAHQQWRRVADRPWPEGPKLTGFMDEAEHDGLAYMDFRLRHRGKLYFTNPFKRLNGDIKRRKEVVGIFPNEDAIARLVGAIMLEQNDERAVQRSRSWNIQLRSIRGFGWQWHQKSGRPVRCRPVMS